MPEEAGRLAGTAPLAATTSGIDDLLLAGLRELLDQELEKAIRQRERSVLFTGPGTARDAAVLAHRRQLCRSLGLRDARVPCDALEFVATTKAPSLVAEHPAYEVHAVRWPVLPGVTGEGLFLRPRRPAAACVVALPDADQSPEALAGLEGGAAQACAYPVAGRLAAAGCAVVVPVVIDRDDTWSGNPRIRMTNQPHREYIYRMAYEMGRHILGYEVQKVLALVDWWEKEHPGLAVGVYGYGEGGLVALCAAAADERIAAALVSGAFQYRASVGEEPIYRNVWRRCRGLTDAELAALIAPRALIIEARPGPTVDGPPPARAGRSGAAPGRLRPALLDEVEREAALARRAYAALGAPERLALVVPDGPGAEEEALARLVAALGVSLPASEGAAPPAGAAQPARAVARVDARARMERQFRELCDFTQRLVPGSAKERDAFWAELDMSSVQAYARSIERYRAYFWDEVIGRCPVPDTPLAPQSRLAESRHAYDLYEVVLHIWPQVPNLGFLLVPKGIAEGEKRPAVVCQHGLGGYPHATLDEGNKAYHGFARRLAERGYVVYAPQNPYIGPKGDAFRVLQFKANALGWSLFSLIAVQHKRILQWLGSLPFVDGARIGFYGLSYGGKTAMRIPALLPEYALSICSGDFNEWIYKTVSTEFRTSYMFTGEYEIFEFDLASTFNYAEMARLICPRPFMVERGRFDPCGDDEWVAFEYAKVRRHYADLGIAERTEIEFFQGGHEIHGVGTFAFLDRHLGWAGKEEKVAGAAGD